MHRCFFWGCKHQKAFCDVKVFIANAPSYNGTQVYSLFDVLNMRNDGSMSNVLGKLRWAPLHPFYFSAFGGMGYAATILYNRPTFLVPLWEFSYSSVMLWLHCTVSYSLLHSTIICLRGAMSSGLSTFTRNT